MVTTTKQRKYGRELWREYLDELYEINKTLETGLERFAKHYLNSQAEIEISDKFDIISYLKSYKVISELIWPVDDNLVKQYEAYKKGKCRKLDFRLVTKSQNSKENDAHSIVLAYQPYVFKDRTVFFPSKCIHSCELTEYLFISFGYVPIVCKHIYSALRKVAEECEKKNIPIDNTILSPIPGYLWDVIRIAENTKIPKKERVKEATFKLLGYIYLNASNPITQKFVWSIIRVNKNIKYLAYQ